MCTKSKPNTTLVTGKKQFFSFIPDCILMFVIFLSPTARLDKLFKMQFLLKRIDRIYG